MRKMQCEICGATDFIKQEGLFVCEHCGMKYSTEDAKKLIIEVEGSITVNNLPQVDSLLTTAKDLLKKNEIEAAKALYIQALSIDAENPNALLGLGACITDAVTYNTMDSLVQVLIDGKKSIELAKKRYGESLDFYAFLNEAVALVALSEIESYIFIKNRIANIDGTSSDLGRSSGLLGTIIDASRNSNAVKASLDRIQNLIRRDITPFLDIVEQSAKDTSRLSNDFYSAYVLLLKYRYFEDYKGQRDFILHDVEMTKKLCVPKTLRSVQELSQKLNVNLGCDENNKCESIDSTENNKTAVVEIRFGTWMGGGQINNGCYVYTMAGTELARCKQGEKVYFECAHKIRVYVKMSGCFGKPVFDVEPGDIYRVTVSLMGKVKAEKIC